MLKEITLPVVHLSWLLPVQIYKQLNLTFSKCSISTVSDITNFAQHGGMIGFYVAEDKTRLELNFSVTKVANVKISTKLMEVARIVSSQ